MYFSTKREFVDSSSSYCLRIVSKPPKVTIEELNKKGRARRYTLDKVFFFIDF